MKRKIVIKTKLHDGIYKSHGGGETHVYYSWNIGPRNLIKAISILSDHKQSMTNAYGNVGNCGSWIEIAGVEMTDWDISDFYNETNPSNFHNYNYISATSKTNWCSHFIDKILSGELAQEREAAAESMEKDRELYQLGDSDALSCRPPNPDYKNEYEYKRGYDDGLEKIEDLNRYEKE